MNPLKSGLNFVRKNPTIIYSLALIALIPLTLYFNTSSAIKSFQGEVDASLMTTALITEKVFDIFASDFIASPEILQEKVERIVKENPEEIAEVQVEIREKEQFKTIASFPQKETAEELPIEVKNLFETAKNLAWNEPRGEAIGFLTIDDAGTRFRNVTKTIYDSSGEKIGVVRLAISLKKIDEHTAQATKRSFVILTISIVLVLFLIINHTRLFEYSVLYRKIREVDRMKDEFLSMTAHELRTPIAAISGYANILKREIGPTLNEAQTEHLSRTIISTERLNDLINDILDVSRIEQGRLSIEFQEMSPQKTIKEVVDELKVKADEKGLQLIFEPKPVVSSPNQEEPSLISADPERLKQVLINIIGNSIKYTMKGRVEVITEADALKGRYSIAVKDTGVGMSAEAQKKLFEKFFRIRTKETAEVSGTGLGLWITKALTEKMQGEIFIESMEGVGSKFTIVFPIIKQQKTSAVKIRKET
ncbi:MAG: hypothetical protein COV69_00325 [Parcubacteria group bacterium CG11_big_fil_rev_8_21_14_0_20_39_14]|nr:MAG: hypothetical protein COV69_00325 [Parcubacteria group bacterium CG11_big_fil_rev_8_21_14_0_20_39_14]PIS35058.1 MAG: hypothetical protein COT36_04335 [Parcubacteria group bacterium CG08_land_8_20_14_0_20_38_56]